MINKIKHQYWMKNLETIVMFFSMVIFVIVNILYFRSYHYVALVIFLVLVILEIASYFRYKYLAPEKDVLDERNKKRFKITFIVAICICALGVIAVALVNYTDLFKDTYGIKYSLFLGGLIATFFATVSLLFVSICFLRDYSIALNRYKKTIALDKNSKIFNMSLGLFKLVAVVIFAFMVSGVDKVMPATNVARYEKEYANVTNEDNTFGFFPESIPEGAKSVEFENFRDFMAAKPIMRLSFVADTAYIENVIGKYSDVTEKKDYSGLDKAAIRTEDGIYTSTFKDYIGKSNCDFYISSGIDPGKSKSGFVVDYNTNTICFFYDGEN